MGRKVTGDRRRRRRRVRQSLAACTTMREPRDDEPGLPPPSPSPRPTSRLRRTLHSLRTSLRPASPFHIGSLKRSGSNKSSASDGELARDERNMRKRNKKNKQEPVASTADSRSTDSSPSVDKKKKDGFMRRMGSIGRKKAEASGSASPSPSVTKESTLESVSPPPELQTTTPEPSTTPTPSVDTPIPDIPTLEVSLPEPVPERELTPPPSPQLSEPVSPIAVTHPVSTRPFTKAAWKRNSVPEMERPVEEPSPSDAMKRRIAFVAQASVDEEGERGGREVGSLEEAVALAREKLAPPATVPPLATDTRTEPEGAQAMPPTPSPAPAPYGDLIEPSKPSHASPSAERREHLYKILVIGELGTGKTSIIKRYVHQFFSQHYRATIGVDFALKVLNWDANTIIRLQLWDIAGQERFGNMTRVYYKEAVGAFIVFDVSRVATFDAVVKWKTDLDAKVQLPDGSPIPCILLANKCDQQKEGIVNSTAKMEEYCREKGFAGWFETSAKENINIEEAARSLVNKILLNDKLLQSNDRDGDKFGLEHKIANGENSRDSVGKSCNC